jgi:CheY-like chemotaxis protein
MTASILIADDEPDIREVLELALQDGQWTLLFATSGDEVLAMAQEQKPAILFLDVVLPGGTAGTSARR